MTQDPTSACRPAPAGLPPRGLRRWSPLLESGAIETVFGYPTGVHLQGADGRRCPTASTTSTTSPRGLVRLSMPGLNVAWPDGDAAARRGDLRGAPARTTSACSTSSRTTRPSPSAFRAEARQWGLCRDEFPDDGHLPASSTSARLAGCWAARLHRARHRRRPPATPAPCCRPRRDRDGRLRPELPRHGARGAALRRPAHRRVLQAGRRRTRSPTACSFRRRQKPARPGGRARRRTSASALCGSNRSGRRSARPPATPPRWPLRDGRPVRAVEWPSCSVGCTPTARRRSTSATCRRLARLRRRPVVGHRRRAARPGAEPATARPSRGAHRQPVLRGVPGPRRGPRPPARRRPRPALAGAGRGQRPRPRPAPGRRRHADPGRLPPPGLGGVRRRGPAPGR